MTVKRRRRVPTSPSKFDVFLVRFVSVFTAGDPQRGIQLGLFPEEIVTLQAMLAEWSPLFALYIDELNSRTRVVTIKIKQFIKDFCDYDKQRSILTRIGSSPLVTIEELELCNVHTTVLRKTPSPMVTSVIETIVIPTVSSVSKGMFKVICSNDQDSSIHIISSATGIQYCYQIGGVMPEKADLTVMYSNTSSKARFDITVPQQFSDQKIYLFFRWVNNSFPEYNSQWGDVKIFMVP